MEDQHAHLGNGLLLGIEGGATRTTCLLTTVDLRPVKSVEAGPGNIRLISDAQLDDLLRSIRAPANQLRAVTIGLAGARTCVDRQRIEASAARIWPGVPCLAVNDLETAFAAAGMLTGSSEHPSLAAPRSDPDEAEPIRILVLSGTGSCCFGKDSQGRSARVGGWGHLVGDRGSGYDLGRRAIEAVLREYDHRGDWPRLGERLLRCVQANEPDDLIDWVRQASKDAVAALTEEVCAAASARDRLARQLVRDTAASLAEDAYACAKRLRAPLQRTTFTLAGGLLLQQPVYAKAVTRELRRRATCAKIVGLPYPSAWGAIALAAKLPVPREAENKRGVVTRNRGRVSQPALDRPDSPVPLKQLAESPTEQRNPRSTRLDRIPLAAAIELFLSEDAGIPQALHRESRAIERACRSIIRALRLGGRLFYVGAGTSGRLGVLDASECPPTFCAPKEQVQAIIAGGPRAIVQAVEGAEDDNAGGARAVHYRGVSKKDVVVGIAASGRTPFVWGALRSAKALGALTILLCFNPALKRLRRERPHILIAPDLGPELLTGSTRLKAGTATKLILNLFSTLGMARSGKVMSNLMIDLNPTNAKLRARAVRLVQELTGLDHVKAERALRGVGWKVRRAVESSARQPRNRPREP